MQRRSQPADPRFGSISWWLDRKAKAIANLYPSGLPAAFPDGVVDDWTGAGQAEFSLPPGASKITRYRRDNPGGRVGTSLYDELIYPIAKPIDKCLVVMTGHVQSFGWWGPYYCLHDGSSVIIRMLLSGWHVLGVNLPAYPGNPNPQQINMGGNLVEVSSNHPYLPAYTDGGASIVRQFTDHCISLNQITKDLRITDFSILGHSGGGNSAIYSAVSDSRYKAVHICQPGSVYWSRGTQTDCQMDMTNPTVAATGAVYEWEFLPLAASHQDRQVVLHVSPRDEYDPAYPEWVGFSAFVDRCVSKHFGSRFTLSSKTTKQANSYTPYHQIDPVQASQIQRHLLANG